MVDLQKVIDVLAQVRSLVSSLAVTIVIVALVLILFRQLGNDAIFVEPIKVPASLVKLGYTPEVTARWVLEDMLEIQRQTTTRKKGKAIAPEWERFDMEVPGSGISMSTLGRVLRESLGIREKKISGEVVGTEADYKLRLRLSDGSRNRQQPELGSKKDVDAMIHAAAENAVQLVAPFMFASYLYASNRSGELDAAIQYSLQHGDEADRKWAHNLRGIMLYEQGDYRGAIESYNDAIKQDKSFALAYHNIANAQVQLSKHKLALDNLLLAVKLDPGLRDASKEADLRIHVGIQYGRESAPLIDQIEMYRHALEINPEATQALWYWGRALMQGPDPDLEAAAEKFAALTEGDNTKATASEKAPAYLKWAEILKRQQKYAAAIEKYQAAIEEDAKGYKNTAQPEIDKLKHHLPANP